MGREEDTAATVRGACTLALLGCTDLTREDKLWAVMRLLTEASPSLRKDGALALELLEGREAALLLRIKARMGDVDSTVTGQVLESLLRVEGVSAVSFIADFLKSTAAEVREEAALALGGSRLEQAVASLKEELTRKHSLFDPETIFRALSISRHQDALAFLYDVLRRRRPREVIAALEALALYRESTEIKGHIATLIANRSEPELQTAFQRLFVRHTIKVEP